MAFSGALDLKCIVETMGGTQALHLALITQTPALDIKQL